MLLLNMTEYQIYQLLMQGQTIGESVDPTAAIIWLHTTGQNMSSDMLGK